MRLPKGASYKLLSTKNTQVDSLLSDLSSQGFSGYIRITVERGEKIEDGYLLLREGVVVGAMFQGAENLFSKEAFDKIREVWGREGILDIHKFTEFQTQISIEENKEALLISAEKVVKKEAEPTDDSIPKPKEHEPAVRATEEVQVPTEPLEISDEDEPSVAQDILEKRKERLELLKKFGLTEPEDEFVGAILQDFNLPSEKELNSKSRELKKEILKRLKQKTDLEELDLYISPAKMAGTVEFNIDVYIKPLNKKIEKEVQSTIESTLKEKLTFPYEKGLKINAA